MKTKIFLVILLFACTYSIAQVTDSTNAIAEKSSAEVIKNDKPLKKAFRDIVALGVGIGQDYGGLGLSVTVYPQKNIGLFGAFGYAFAGSGYNFGTKLRLIPDDRFKRISLFVLGMYGYNAAVIIADSTTYNKIFYGPSAGAGFDLRFVRNGGYFSFGVIIPFRDAEVKDYMDYLEDTKNINFNNDLLPFTISLGYKIVLH